VLRLYFVHNTAYLSASVVSYDRSVGQIFVVHQISVSTKTSSLWDSRCGSDSSL